MKKITLISFVFLTLCNGMLAQPPNYSDSLKYYNKNGQYANAMPFALLQYASVKNLAETDTLRIAAQYDVGFDYYQLGKYDSAVAYFKMTCDAYHALYGEKNQQYLASRADLASAYKNAGQYEVAEKIYLETLPLRRESFGEDAGYATLLNQIGLLYLSLGKYNKAEDFFIRECVILKRSGEKTAAYALAAGNLALVYSRVGNYPRAEKLQSQALEIRRELLGEKHPLYALALSNLGTIYANMGDYGKADSLQTISLAVTRQALKETHPQYLRGLHNLGVNRTNLNDYSSAESFYKQALTGWKNTYGEDDADYLYMFDALSNLYLKMGRRELADSLFHQSLAHYNRLQLTQHPYRLDLLYHLIDLYLAANNRSAAKPYLKEAMLAERKALLDKLDFLSETELLFYLQKRTQAKVLAEPYLFLAQQRSPDMLRAAYDHRLFFSGIAVENWKSLTAGLSTTKDSSLARLWLAYQANKAALNKLLSLPYAKRINNADSLGEAVNQQEKDLLRLSADYRNMKEKLGIRWTNVRDHLKPNEAAIEFVKFEDKRSAHETFTWYAAMVVRAADTMPQFVTLVEEQRLLHALKSFAYKAPGSTRSGSVAGSAGDENTHNTVYKMVWQPLEPYLHKIRTVFFSPDGLLHQLAFAAIPYKKDSLLCDRYQLVQLSSTRQMAIPANTSSPNPSIALFGGINYSRQAYDSSQPFSADVYAYAYQQNRGIGTDSFHFLPHTLSEVKVIEREMADRSKKALLFTGANATEQAFYQLGGEHSPQIIHFATHGFTLPGMAGDKDAANVFQIAADPLLRCGLVMAGGNTGWKGQAQPNEDDGILTGLEISAVRLPNTELVVLSACETGLGQALGSEGIFGLQRAFKLAGAKYVMASLWQVPDKETAYFMERFYKEWLSGKTIRQAFLHTQQIFRRQYPPYYWAGFILVQ